MRRFVFGLSFLFAAAGLLLFSSCADQDNVFRVTSMNRGMPIRSDIADWMVWNDPTIPDSEEDIGYIYQVHDDTADVEFQYIAVGPGLPTWTPYTAEVKEYTITYASTQNSGTTYDPVTLPTSIAVQADPTTKKSTIATLVVAPAWWKLQYFGDDISDSPNTDFELLDVVTANVQFTADDPVSGKTVKATGTVELQFADFYDDPSRFGQ